MSASGPDHIDDATLQRVIERATHYQQTRRFGLTRADVLAIAGEHHDRAVLHKDWRVRASPLRSPFYGCHGLSLSCFFAVYASCCQRPSFMVGL